MSFLITKVFGLNFTASSRKVTKDTGDKGGHAKESVTEVHVEEEEKEEVGHTRGKSQERQEEDEEEEEIIRCVCNIYRDEGLMIQCEKCEVSR